MKKIVIVSSVFFVVVGVVIYPVIYAPQLANMEQIIPIRHAYERAVIGVRGWLRLPGTDHYGEMGTAIRVLVRVSDDGVYRYSLQGRLEQINAEQGTISLRCSNGKTYKFEIITLPVSELGWVGIDGMSDQERGMTKNKWIFSTTDITKSGERDPWYSERQIYAIVWKDKRSLSQILSDYKANPDEAINKNAEVRAEIRRYDE